MFDKIRQRYNQYQEEKEHQKQVEKEQLLSLSENELLIELLFEMRELGKKLDEIEVAVQCASINNN